MYTFTHIYPTTALLACSFHQLLGQCIMSHWTQHTVKAGGRNYRWWLITWLLCISQHLCSARKGIFAWDLPWRTLSGKIHKVHAMFKWNSRAQDSDVLFFYLRTKEEELVNAKSLKLAESSTCTKFCAAIHGRSCYASVHDHVNFFFFGSIIIDTTSQFHTLQCTIAISIQNSPGKFHPHGNSSLPFLRRQT